MKLVEAANVAQILIVEDECLIRMLATDIAVEEGYVALEAGNSEEALAILKSDPGIDLVFTDIDMPGDHDGLALAGEIKRSWPSIRIVITSGKIRPLDSDLPDGSLFLPKPYRPDELADAFTKALTW